MSKPRPLQVGITGGIGSGKSLIARIFATLGVPIYDADSRARYLMQYNEVLKADLIRLLGPAAYQPNGVLNRSYVAAQVFTDPQKTTQINQLVHPLVREDYRTWTQQHHQQPYLLKEAALLFESGSYRELDQIIVVQAPLELRIRRILQRDPHRSKADIQAIMSKQLDEDEKLKRADFIIHNDECQLVIPQVLTLHTHFNQ